MGHVNYEKRRQSLVKNCPAVVTTEACAHPSVINYPEDKYGRVTFPSAISFSTSMHSYSFLWVPHCLKHGYVFKLKYVFKVSPRNHQGGSVLLEEENQGRGICPLSWTMNCHYLPVWPNWILFNPPCPTLFWPQRPFCCIKLLDAPQFSGIHIGAEGNLKHWGSVPAPPFTTHGHGTPVTTALFLIRWKESILSSRNDAEKNK